MFNLSSEQVHLFFQDVWKKANTSNVLSPLEVMTFSIMQQHVEFYDLYFQDTKTALKENFFLNTRKDGYLLEQQHKQADNPYLHLSLHLAVHEQISINQPIGIVPLFENLVKRLDSVHQANHEIIFCLIKEIKRAQINTSQLDSALYLQNIKQRVDQI